ncbi:3'-5' exonuclease [Halalkalibacter akibai]|uniref:Exonuclease n=1 Tax=Halalkalibacter akibai (strain ATCC 43226 / DSM 21942 / CIP 109018 / JCM 9157 / 1139) TaxID=1236973 RepID=W4R064_HALA3|nr:3'-5' exonuclease [Halalkalibacter akibai]GAE36929.1 exonuclease [Halalkalibacter akibai JCM 9157]
MIAVIFDLELMKRFRKGQPSEIVEIGACKVDLGTKKIIDQLQVYILPSKGHISKSTRKLIKMKEEDVEKAVSYQTGIELFKDWLGDEPYYLCSWGKDDRAHFINQSVRNKLDLTWLKNYNDIQRPIGKLLSQDINNQLGLKNALEIAGIELLGKAHRGIDDALNTASLFIKFIDDIPLEENSLSDKEIQNHYKKYKRSRFRHLDRPSRQSPN